MSERHTFNQISEQYEASHQEPTVLIRRSNGDIQTARLTNRVDEQGRRIAAFEDEKLGKAEKGVNGKGLTDEAQELLAQELAESSIVRGAESYERIGKAEKSLANVALELTEVQQPIAIAEVQDTPRQKVEIHLKKENIQRAAMELHRTLAGELAQVFNGIEDNMDAQRAAIDPNDGDPELRRRLEAVLRNRIDELGSKQLLPERVQDNSPGNLKSIPSNRFGYNDDRYLSRDYSAKLALAMLDGSFDGDPRKKDYADLPADHPHNGQHRQAARLVLESFAEQKKSEQQDSPEEEAESGDALNEVKSVLRRLNEDEDLARVEYLVRDLDEEFGRGLPNIIDTDQVNYQLRTYESQLEAASEAIHESLARIASLSGDIEPSDQATLEEIQRNASSAHYQLESARQMIGMLASKVDELAYDQGAQLEVRSLFTQQMPQAIYELQQALYRIKSTAE